ncbi:MAG: flagellar export chaperone FliS [Vicinamibacterales bacterium]
MYANRGINAYRQTEVQSRSSLELVVMLYDGALRFMHDAKRAFDEGDIRRRAEAITRTMAIIDQLQNTLDMKAGGDIAKSLDQLYTFVRDRLLEASMQKQGAPVDKAIAVIANLRDGWAEISARERLPVAK